MEEYFTVRREYCTDDICDLVKILFRFCQIIREKCPRVDYHDYQQLTLSFTFTDRCASADRSLDGRWRCACRGRGLAGVDQIKWLSAIAPYLLHKYNFLLYFCWKFMMSNQRPSSLAVGDRKNRVVVRGGAGKRRSRAVPLTQKVRCKSNL